MSFSSFIANSTFVEKHQAMKLTASFFTLWLLMVFVPVTTSAQQNSTPKTGPVVGYEMDALPFVLGGYYGSMWAGSRHVRVRGIISEAKVPDFFLNDGFTNNRIKTYAAIADYFFAPGFEKWWIGAGLEYWQGRVQTDAKLSTERYAQAMLTFGGGYIWKFHKNFYLNPWAGFHVRAAGDRKVMVENQEFRPPAITPQVSLKIGWHFNRKRLENEDQ